MEKNTCFLVYSMVIYQFCLLNSLTFSQIYDIIRMRLERKNFPRACYIWKVKGVIKMFKVGDKIVYPMHGAGTIESIEEKEILGEKQKYYVMKMPVGDIKVMVPTKNAELIGVRDVIGNDAAQNVLDVLSAAPTDMSSNWNKRYRDNQDKMKSGDICEVADVVRNLSFRAKVKPLATGEKKMLTSAKQILVSELVLAEAMDKDQVESLINERIDEAYSNYKSNEV